MRPMAPGARRQTTPLESESVTVRMLRGRLVGWVLVTDALALQPENEPPRAPSVVAPSALNSSLLAVRTMTLPSSNAPNSEAANPSVSVPGGVAVVATIDFDALDSYLVDAGHAESSNWLLQNSVIARLPAGDAFYTLLWRTRSS